jgi:septum formation topological specificity factor MinE
MKSEALMEEPKNTSMEARRDRTGGIVRDKLDILMAEMRREQIPPHLIQLAEDLQSAIDARQADGDPSS